MKTLKLAWAALLAASVCVAAHAQTSKPGLWEITSNMKMAGAPQIPPDTLAKMKAQGIKVPGLDGQQTHIKMCVTPEMVEKFGGPEPQTRAGCTLENVQRSGNGMSAELVCTGQTNGKATITATRSDSTHSAMSMHFTGTSREGRPMDFQMESTSVFLGESCGDVKPGHPLVD
jgi:hypothetical protein